MTTAGYSAQSDPTRPLSFISHAEREDMLSSFKGAFGVDFFDYRGEVRRVAETSLKRVESAQVTLGFDDAEEWFYDENDEFVFPTDDDDLFRPDLAKTLDHVRTDTNILVWDILQAGFNGFGPEPVCERYSWAALGSNNWGVRKSFLRAAFPDEWRRFLSEHGFAQQRMVEHLRISAEDAPAGRSLAHADLDDTGVLRLEETYSLNVLHVGALTVFLTLAERGGAPDLYRAYDLDSPIPLMDAARWAEPYLQEISSTIRRLRAKR